MLLRLLPLVTGVAPLLTVFTCYAIAIETAGLPACNPFLDGCTSVSATGRHAPASFLFRAVMLPQAIVLAGYWLASFAWCRAMQRSLGRDDRRGAAIAWFGMSGALFLLPYVTFLGSEEPFYEFMRRYGVYLYFLLNVVAQILLASRALPLVRELGLPRSVVVIRIQLILAWIPFALGALNLVLKATLEDPDAAENRIEWVFALLMQLYFVLSYVSWRETQFSVAAAIRPRPGELPSGFPPRH